MRPQTNFFLGLSFFFFYTHMTGPHAAVITRVAILLFCQFEAWFWKTRNTPFFGFPCSSSLFFFFLKPKPVFD